MNGKIPFSLIVAARRSPLSLVQVREVEAEMRTFHPTLSFQCLFVDTQGDKDQTTSLRTLDKTDFFTKEIDALLLECACRIAIHSAKDLPEPLPAGLTLAALTQGLNSADVLVLRENVQFHELPPKSIVATSSERRENAVKLLRDDLSFIDIRGTIGQRLAKLETGEVDGVVIAEAALIRLGLTHLNRIRLPGDTVPLQGKLAVVVRHDDEEMIHLFSCIDSRKGKQ